MGLAGCGFAGRLHSRSLVLAACAKGLSGGAPVLAAAADTNFGLAQSVAGQFGWERAVSSWEQLLAFDLDLLIVALPNHLHLEVARAAITDGIAVFCEKPLGSQVEHAVELCRLAGDDPRHRVGFVHRFLPAVRQAKELLESGAIGDLQSVTGVYAIDMRNALASNDWRFSAATAGHGVIGDLASHHIDLVRMLVGEITSVLATSRTLALPGAPPADNEDLTAALLEVDGGVVGVLTASRVGVAATPVNHLEIAGRDGVIRIDRARLNEVEVRDRHGISRRVGASPQGSAIDPWVTPTVQSAFSASWYDCFAFQMMEVLQIVAKDGPDPVWSASLADALATAQVVEAIARSAAGGRREPVG